MFPTLKNWQERIKEKEPQKVIHLHQESKHIEYKDKDSKNKRKGAPEGDTLASRVQTHRTQNAFKGEVTCMA